MEQDKQLEFVSIEEQPTPAPQPEQINEQPKKKRGRPKKSEQTPSEEPIKPAQNPVSLFEQIKKEVEENEKVLTDGQTPGPINSPIHDAASKVVDGYMLLTICDTFFPMIIKAFFKKAKGLKDTDIRLSKEQKEHLTPIADDVATGLLSFLDPVTLFFILTGALYFQNTTEAISKKEK